MTQSMLTTLHIDEMLRERHLADPRMAARVVSPEPAGLAPPDAGPHVQLPVRLRRRLGALLIRAGRRLGDGTRSPGSPLYGPAPR
jgi:hypothetical protein